ncbi:MAG: NAD(P)/FAD-dependent oxidoreductase [Alphaproteobacteria bacterium]
MTAKPFSEKEISTVTVIGAGIVGTCCATYLQRLGLKVTMIDRVAPGESCSSGNAGVLSSWSCIPDSVPGIAQSVPGWLLDPEGPLAIRWRYLPQAMPWLIKFILAGRADKIPAISDALFALNNPTVDLYKELVRAAGINELISESSYLYVYRNLGAANPDNLSWRLRREHGAKMDFLSGGEVQEVEPEISPLYRRAVAIHNQGHTINPARLVQALAGYFEQQGGRILRGEVKHLARGSSGPVIMETTIGELSSDFLVIAAGAWSHRLTAQLGCKIPLETERGYHMTFANPGVSLNHTIMEGKRRFVTTAMEVGIRCAGTAEFAGLDAPPNRRRARILTKLGKELLPNLNTQEATDWMGHRPALPDSLPVIGALPGHPNVLTAFGHGHTGLTGAPMTGRIIAGLIAGKPLNVDVTPYRPGRFI